MNVNRGDCFGSCWAYTLDRYSSLRKICTDVRKEMQKLDWIDKPEVIASLLKLLEEGQEVVNEDDREFFKRALEVSVDRLFKDPAPWEGSYPLDSLQKICGLFGLSEVSDRIDEQRKSLQITDGNFWSPSYTMQQRLEALQVIYRNPEVFQEAIVRVARSWNNNHAPEMSYQEFPAFIKIMELLKASYQYSDGLAHLQPLELDAKSAETVLVFWRFFEDSTHDDIFRSDLSFGSLLKKFSLEHIEAVLDHSMDYNTETYEPEDLMKNTCLLAMAYTFMKAWVRHNPRPSQARDFLRELEKKMIKVHGFPQFRMPSQTDDEFLLELLSIFDALHFEGNLSILLPHSLKAAYQLYRELGAGWKMGAAHHKWMIFDLILQYENHYENYKNLFQEIEKAIVRHGENLEFLSLKEALLWAFEWAPWAVSGVHSNEVSAKNSYAFYKLLCRFPGIYQELGEEWKIGSQHHEEMSQQFLTDQNVFSNISESIGRALAREAEILESMTLEEAVEWAFRWVCLKGFVFSQEATRKNDYALYRLICRILDDGSISNCRERLYEVLSRLYSDIITSGTAISVDSLKICKNQLRKQLHCTLIKEGACLSLSDDLWPTSLSVKAARVDQEHILSYSPYDRLKEYTGSADILDLVRYLKEAPDDVIDKTSQFQKKIRIVQTYLENLQKQGSEENINPRIERNLTILQTYTDQVKERLQSANPSEKEEIYYELKEYVLHTLHHGASTCVDAQAEAAETIFCEKLSAMSFDDLKAAEHLKRWLAVKRERLANGMLEELLDAAGADRATGIAYWKFMFRDLFGLLGIGRSPYGREDAGYLHVDVIAHKFQSLYNAQVIIDWALEEHNREGCIRPLKSETISDVLDATYSNWRDFLKNNYDRVFDEKDCLTRETMAFYLQACGVIQLWWPV